MVVFFIGSLKVSICCLRSQTLYANRGHRASVMPAPVTFSTARIKPPSRKHVTIVNLERKLLARLSLQAA
jgi:hypothetical protein